VAVHLTMCVSGGANLLFAVNSLSVAPSRRELADARQPVEFGALVRWMHVPSSPVRRSSSSCACFSAGSAGPAAATIASRAAALLVNFLQPNLNFVEITSLRRVAFLGEDVWWPLTVSRWTRLGVLSSILLVAFLLSAALSPGGGERGRAAIVGGSMVLFSGGRPRGTGPCWGRGPLTCSASYLASSRRWDTS
jgi:hypothetical protein